MIKENKKYRNYAVFQQTLHVESLFSKRLQILKIDNEEVQRILLYNIRHGQNSRAMR